jgi:hypothetical protein
VRVRDDDEDVESGRLGVVIASIKGCRLAAS